MLLFSCSVVSSSLLDMGWSHALQSTRLLRPWNSQGKNTGAGCHFLLQGIFPTQRLNPWPLSCLLHSRWVLDCWTTGEALRIEYIPLKKKIKKQSPSEGLPSWWLRWSRICLQWGDLGLNPREDPLEKGMTTHSNILAWRVSWIEKPGGLQSTGSQRAGHDWVTNTRTYLSES